MDLAGSGLKMLAETCQARVTSRLRPPSPPPSRIHAQHLQSSSWKHRKTSFPPASSQDAATRRGIVGANSEECISSLSRQHSSRFHQQQLNARAGGTLRRHTVVCDSKLCARPSASLLNLVCCVRQRYPNYRRPFWRMSKAPEPDDPRTRHTPPVILL